MPLAALENLARVDAAEAERKRREQLAQEQEDERALADKAVAEKAAAKTGPAALLQDLMARGHPAVAGDVVQNAAEDQFLNEQRTRQLGRQADALAARKAKLGVPLPTTVERYATLAAPLGRFATDEPTREDLPELKQLRAGMDQPDVSRETPDRFYYREEPSGTLAFTNRPEVAAQAGYRRYNSDSGTTKDLGAPGGGLTTVSSKPATDRTPQRAVLDQLIATTERKPLTRQEMAQDLVTQQPGWDTMAARTSPGEIQDQVLAAVGAGRLRPETGAYLQKRYQGLERAATDSTTGELDPQLWQERLRQGRPPAPGEAEARAKTGGTVLPAAEQQQQAAVQEALQAPQGGPGSTQSPALAAESISSPTRAPTPQVTPGAMPSQRRPMPVGAPVESLDALLASIYGAGEGPSPDAAIAARRRDALLRSLGR